MNVITRSANAPLINKSWIPNLKTIGDSAYDFSAPKDFQEGLEAGND